MGTVSGIRPAVSVGENQSVGTWWSDWPSLTDTVTLLHPKFSTHQTVQLNSIQHLDVPHLDIECSRPGTKRGLTNHCHVGTSHYHFAEIVSRVDLLHVAVALAVK